MVPKHEIGSVSVSSTVQSSRPNQKSRPDQIQVQFLGTASGFPTATRAHNCLGLRLGGEVWIFDAGESAQLQLSKSSLKAGKISTIFITHLHGDHVYGLGPLVCSLGQAFGSEQSEPEEKVSNMDNAPIQLEIYGPLGTRAYLRNQLRYSYAFLQRRYRVHELLMPGEVVLDDGVLHPCEVVGKDIQAQQVNGSVIFEDILIDDEHRAKDPFFTVHAAPIRHTIPTLGFVIQESSVPGSVSSEYVQKIKNNRGTPMSVLKTVKAGTSVTLPDGTVLMPPVPTPGRKICILGDTCDPSNIADLASRSDVLIHEATNAYIPGLDKSDSSYESVESNTISHGHSTPQMAADFATKIGASALVLNHFSSRYKGDACNESTGIMNHIRDLAQSRFKGGPVFTARDWSSYDVSKSRGVIDNGITSKHAT